MGEGGESSEEAATSGAENQGDSDTAEAKQAGQRKRVYAQDARRLKVSTKRAGEYEKSLRQCKRKG